MIQIGGEWGKELKDEQVRMWDLIGRSAMVAKQGVDFFSRPAPRPLQNKVSEPTCVAQIEA